MSPKPPQRTDICPAPSDAKEASATVNATPEEADDTAPMTIKAIVGAYIHDSNNLLTAAYGAMEILSKLLHNPAPEINNQIMTIRRALERLIIDNRNFIRHTSSIPPAITSHESEPPAPMEIDINRFIKAEIQFQRELDNKNTEFDVDLLPETIVLGDEFEIHKILDNLIINAKQAIQRTDNKGVIKISTSVDEDFAYIKISDNGCGIKPEHRLKLFTEGFTTKPQKKGHGVALYQSLR